MVKLLDTHKEMILASEVYHNVHPVKVAHGRLTLRQNENARPNLMTDLRTALIRITGEQWMVVADKAAGAPTLAEQAQARQRAEVDAAAQHPVVKAVLEAFPEAQIHVKDIETDEL